MPSDIKNEKKIDGLKAGNEAIANSRKIVLESIGEEEKIAKKSEEKNFMLDGLARKKMQKIEEQNAQEIEKEKIEKNNIQKLTKENSLKFIDSINFLHPADEKYSAKTDMLEKQNELKKRISSNQINPALLEDINKKGIGFDDLLAISKNEKKKIIESNQPSKVFVKKENIKKPNIEQKAKHDSKEDIEQKKNDDDLKKKKEKEEEVIKKSKEKKEKAKQEKEKKERETQQKKQDKQNKKEKRNKELKDVINKIKLFFVRFADYQKNNFLKILKKSLLFIVISFFLFLLIYFAYIITIIKFNIDKPFTRALSRYAIVPAFIVKNQVVGFYFWQDLLEQSKKQEAEDVKMTSRKNLAKYLAMNELAERYKLDAIPYEDIEKDVPKKLLAKKALYDENANLVAIKRIRSIKKAIDNKDDFVRVSEKLGDELGKTTITPENKEKISNYKELEGLNVNEVSDIIVSESGYYIYRCFEKNENEQILSYVLVKNKSFDLILEEMIAGYKFISFVD